MSKADELKKPQEDDFHPLYKVVLALVRIGLTIWTLLLWPVRQSGRAILFAINTFMFPDGSTGRPHKYALAVWALLNAGLVLACFIYLQDTAQLSLAAALGVLHFLIICTALLVISEEMDVWNGYILSNAPQKPDERFFRRGKAAKSVPLIIISGVSYILFVAMALRGAHAQFEIFSTGYDAELPLWHYMLAVATQMPVLRNIAGEFDGFFQIEFAGIAGIITVSLIYAANLSVLIGSITSYFRQHNEIRKLLDAMASNEGDNHFLNERASHAPDDIKPHLIRLALHAPQARVRRGAMSVAQHKNVQKFPKTILHNLHEEPVSANKNRAVSVSTNILEKNKEFDDAMLNALLSKVDHQLNERATVHSEHLLELLRTLRTEILKRQAERTRAKQDKAA